jgi:endoglucanase
VAVAALSAVSGWRTHNGQIYDNEGHPYRVRGMSWFGYESGEDGVPHGLWAHPVEWYVDLLRAHGVNTLRVPFSVDWAVYRRDMYPFEGLVAGDPGGKHKKSVEILDRLFDATAAAGIQIMLDNHRNAPDFIGELWYEPADGKYTSQTFMEAWYWLLDRYGERPNLMAIDVKNEPHGRATWGDGNPSTDWRLFAETAIAKISARYPNNTWLFVVEGIGWGKDLSRALEHPIRMPPGMADRLALSPHSYGRSVTPSVDIGDTVGLRKDWDAHFGYLRPHGVCLITGEWGGRTDVDRVWMDSYVAYLRELNATDTFFWSLGPNSGDVAGFLLDDWTTVDPVKADLLRSFYEDV